MEVLMGLHKNVQNQQERKRALARRSFYTLAGHSHGSIVCTVLSDF